MSLDLDYDADDQDQAEAFDEDITTGESGDIAHPDMQPDEFDVTRADGDDDDEEALDDDGFDPDAADDDEIDTLLEEDDGIDSDTRPTRDPADLVMETESTPAEFEGDDGSIDEDDDAPVASDGPPSPRKERELDHGIEETFPASDPVSINLAPIEKLSIPQAA